MSSWRFWISVVIFALPVLYVAYDFSDATLGVQMESSLWFAAPLMIAVILFVFGAKAAAWGWLIAVGVTTYITVVEVYLSASSTGSLAFFWVPIWNVLLVGPVGLAIGILTRKSGSQPR
jgi:hypothetical protein